MKASYIVVALLAGLLGVVALVVLWIVPTGFVTSIELPAAVRPASHASADERGAEVEELRTALAMLEGRVGALSAELELLRTAVQRRPAEAPDVSASEALLSAAQGGEFNDAQRQAITDILARAREKEAALRAEERAEREEQMILDRAGRIAEGLGLAPADQRLLEGHLRTESERRREIIDRSRQPDYDRELLRDEFVALRDWSEQHLSDTFGADLAEQIRQAERETRGASLDRGAGLERAGRGRPEPGPGRRDR